MKPSLRETTIKVQGDRITGGVSPFLYGAGFEHLGGAVHLGLDAQMLDGGSFEEEDVNQDGIADAWRPAGWGEGAVRYSRDSQAPFPGQYAQKIEILSIAQGEWGIKQGGLSLVRQKRYAASFYLRQKGLKAGGPVKVYLRGKRKVYAQGIIPKVSSEWKKHTLILTPDTTTADGEFMITLSGNGILWIDQISLVPEDTFLGHGTRRDLMEKILQLQPTCLRWPGGWFSEIYRWKDGVGEVDRRPWRKKYYSSARMKNNPSWESNRLGTDEFIRFCRDVGAVPILTVNMGYESQAGLEDYLTEASQWVEYCNGGPATPMGALRAGHGSEEPYSVCYWEIGNEPWEMDPREYALRFIQFAQVMKEKDPQIKLIAAGGNSYDMRWNEEVVEVAGAHMDYLDLHYYYSNEDYLDAMAEPLNFGDFLDRLRDKISSVAPGKSIKASILEWNSNNTWKDANRLKEGLFAAAFLHVLERRGDWVEQAVPWPLLRRVQPPGNHVSDHGLIWYDNRRVYLSSTALAFQLYRKNYAPERLPCEVSCETFDTRNRKKVPYLDAVAGRDKERNYLILKVINKSPNKKIRTSIDFIGLPWGANPGRATVSTLSGPDTRAKNSFEHPHEVRITESAWEVDNWTWDYVFPAHSVTVFRVPVG